MKTIINNVVKEIESINESDTGSVLSLKFKGLEEIDMAKKLLHMFYNESNLKITIIDTDNATCEEFNYLDFELDCPFQECVLNQGMKIFYTKKQSPDGIEYF